MSSPGQVPCGQTKLNWPFSDWSLGTHLLDFAFHSSWEQRNMTQCSLLQGISITLESDLLEALEWVPEITVQWLFTENHSQTESFYCLYTLLAWIICHSSGLWKEGVLEQRTSDLNTIEPKGKWVSYLCKNISSGLHVYPCPKLEKG